MTTAKQLYRNFIKESAYPWCWLCGRDQWQRPEWWNAAWILHRAHIVRSPRAEDFRTIVICCPWCHAVAHGIRFDGAERPPITIANLLWLKRHFDPENYSRAFLKRYSVKRLPRAVKPASVYLAEYRQRHAA